MVTVTVIEVALQNLLHSNLNLLRATMLAAFVLPAIVPASALAQKTVQGAASNQATPQAVPQIKQRATPSDAQTDPRRGGRQQAQPPVDPTISPIGVGRRTTSERALRIIPGFSVGATASDNIDLRSAQTRGGGGLLEVSPFVEVRIRRPGSTADLSASVRGQKFFDSEIVDERLDGNLAAGGDFSIVGNQLRLRGSADLFRIDETGLGGTAVTGGARSRNTTRFKSLNLTPYSIGKLGMATEYELGYQYQLIDRGVENDSHRVFGELQNAGFGDGRLGLLGRFDARQVSYENGLDYDNISGLLGVSWALTGRLKIGAGLYYSAIDTLINADGDNSGVGPALYWDWRASERSAFQGQIADAYYGENIAVRFRQLFSRWVFSANYRKNVEDGNEASTFLFRPINAFRGSTRRSSDQRLNDFNAKLAERDLVLDSGAQLFVSSLDTALVFDDTVSLSAAFIRSRSAGLVSVFVSDRSAATTVFSSNSDSEINQVGLYGVFDYLLNSRNSLRLVGQVRDSDLPTSGQSALFTGVDLSWRYSLNRRAWVRFSVRHSLQDGDGGAESYKETAGSIVYTYRYQ